MIEPSVAPQSTDPIISLRIAYPSSLLFSSTLSTRPPPTRKIRKLRRSMACQRIPANTSAGSDFRCRTALLLFCICFLCDGQQNSSAGSGGCAGKRCVRPRLRHCAMPAQLRDAQCRPPLTPFFLLLRKQRIQTFYVQGIDQYLSKAQDQRIKIAPVRPRPGCVSCQGGAGRLSATVCNNCQPRCSLTRLYQLIITFPKQEVGAIRINLLSQDLAFVENLTHFPRWRNVVRSPVKPLLIRQVSPEIAQPGADLIIVLVVNRHNPQPAATQQRILHSVLTGLLVVLVQYLSAKMHRSQIIGRVEDYPLNDFPERPDRMCR